PTACPGVGLPTFADFTAMYPFASISPGGPGADAASIDHPEDLNSLSRFYSTADYASLTGIITGTVFLPDGVTPVNGVNVIARNVADPFLDARSTVTGDLSFVAGDAFEGTFILTGLTPGSSYTLAVDNIVAGAFPKPPAAPFTEEYWNGDLESNDPAVDDPCDIALITPAAGVPFTANIFLNP
ncbi:MAG: carboxypeptidase-like regulatory domain-containing protein, partial [Candidatus Binatia bacterium]